MTEGGVGNDGTASFLCHTRFLSLCHSRKFLAGIQSFFFVPSFVCPCMGKPLDSRLKTSGMTEGGVGHNGREAVGNPTSFT